jgi:hypothetical protein
MATNRGRGLGDPLTAGIPEGFSSGSERDFDRPGVFDRSTLGPEVNQGIDAFRNNLSQNQQQPGLGSAFSGGFGFPFGAFPGPGLSFPDYPNVDPFGRNPMRDEFEEIFRDLLGGRRLQERSSTTLSPRLPGLGGGVAPPTSLGARPGMNSDFLRALLSALGQGTGRGGFGVPFNPGPLLG